MLYKNFRPRPSQQAVLAYTGGYMGIAAVPGSGKTQVLSALAAKLITSGLLQDDQEVMVVTMTNSAVENFRQRIQMMLHDAGLVSNFGYRVMTLHSLASDIVKSRPDLANLPAAFTIIDQDESDEIMDDIIPQLMLENQSVIDALSAPGLFDVNPANAALEWRRALKKYGFSFIKQAKDYSLLPRELAERMYAQNALDDYFILGNNLYDLYQRELERRNGIDFSDLIRLAHQLITSDAEVLERLTYQWPFILEDEAQDSSRLQEEILRLLAGQHGNWVRVGDRNQAIFESFTTANPEFLTNFIHHPATQSLELPYSGRSTTSIIGLANTLIDLTHSPLLPNPALHGSLHYPLIRPTPLDDPQQNPQDRPDKVYIVENRYDSDNEIKLIAKHAKRWFDSESGETAAILVPDNAKAAKMVGELRSMGVDVVELLATQQEDRDMAAVLAAIYGHYAMPYNLQGVVKLLQEWARLQQLDSDVLAPTIAWLEAARWPEHLLELGMDAGESLTDELSQAASSFLGFLSHVHRLYTLLPDEQILGFIPLLARNPAEVSLLQSLSIFINRFVETHPDWSFIDLSREMEQIVRLQTSFRHNALDMSGFEPDQHRGKVLVATMHKAKGLEWDRVYLMGVNSYDFPLGLEGDQFRGELPILQGKASLEAEFVKRVNIAAGNHNPRDDDSTDAARIKYAAERIRLLFVGITRARKELIISWNDGKRHDMTMAVMLQMLHQTMQDDRHE